MARRLSIRSASLAYVAELVKFYGPLKLSNLNLVCLSVETVYIHFLFGAKQQKQKQKSLLFLISLSGDLIN